MSFANRALDVQRGRKGGQCSAGVLLDSLDRTYAAEVLAVMADMSVYSSVIAEILGEDGHTIAPETLNRHRRGRCKCER